MRRVYFALAVLAIGCGDARPAAIVVDADPFLLNGPGPVGLPARVLSASGATLTNVPLAGASDADSVATVDNGAVRCRRRGDARLTLGAGALTASMLVQCRPVVTFAPFSIVELEMGGASGSIPVVAYDTNGRQVTDLRFSALVHDTSVAMVQRGQVVPRSLGQTRIDLDFGGVRTTGMARVVATVLTESVSLAAGEYRRWPLTAGRFRISAHAPDGRSVAGVTYRVADANCARDSQHRETIHCVVADSAQVVLLSSRPVSLVLRVVRMKR